METLPNRIRKIRQAKGLTQSDIADKLNITPSTYGKIERNANHSSYETLNKVAEAISVPLYFLLDTKSNNFIE